MREVPFEGARGRRLAEPYCITHGISVCRFCLCMIAGPSMALVGGTTAATSIVLKQTSRHEARWIVRLAARALPRRVSGPRAASMEVIEADETSDDRRTSDEEIAASQFAGDVSSRWPCGRACPSLRSRGERFGRASQARRSRCGRQARRQRRRPRKLSWPSACRGRGSIGGAQRLIFRSTMVIHGR